jgi:hypothetical protein
LVGKLYGRERDSLGIMGIVVRIILKERKNVKFLTEKN